MAIKAYFAVPCLLCLLAVSVNKALGGEKANGGLGMVNHAQTTACIYHLTRSPEKGLAKRLCKTMKTTGGLLADATDVYEAIKAEKTTGIYECQNFVVIVIHKKYEDEKDIAFLKCDAMLEVANQLRAVLLLPDKLKYTFIKIQDYLDEEGMTYDYAVAINREELFKQENTK